MAISIDWGTSVISVPQDYLTLVSGDIYELDIDQFRLDLKALEDDEAGIAFTDTHSHTPEIEVAGITYAKVIEILSPYTITFEDGSYMVNLVGANSNIMDKVNFNYVSVRGNNSAGLVSSSTTLSSISDDLAFIRQIEQGRWKIANNQMTFFGLDNETPIRVFDLKDSSGQPTEVSVYERTPA